MEYKYHPTTKKLFAEIAPGSQAHAEAMHGMKMHEPIVIILDSLLKYVEAYAKRYDDKIGTDAYDCTCCKKNKT